MAKQELKDDIAVRWREIAKQFDPPPSESTIHRWKKEGRVKEARDAPGYYLLNATRLHQGMPAVDIRAYREARESVSTGLRNSQLLYLAVLESEPAFETCCPPRFEMPDALTVEEIAKIRVLREQHFKLIECYEERIERIIYRHGFLDALDEAAFVDGK